MHPDIMEALILYKKENITTLTAIEKEIIHVIETIPKEDWEVCMIEACSTKLEPKHFMIEDD